MADEVLFGVIDRGAGVPEEHTSRIFERFYQVDPSRSDSEGTGIGLAICRHIIEAHGGHIRAESNATMNGGRFYFTIPVGVSPLIGPGSRLAGNLLYSHDKLTGNLRGRVEFPGRRCGSDCRARDPCR